jgi:hypothetical protein
MLYFYFFAQRHLQIAYSCCGARRSQMLDADAKLPEEDGAEDPKRR